MASGAERERFLAAFLSCWEIHKDKEPTKIILSAYQAALAQFSIEQIESAFVQAIVSLRWFPKPVELIEIITGGGAQEIEDRAQTEAHRVLGAVRRVGGYQSVKFDDEVTQAVIKQGFNGWHNLCADMTEASAKWFIRDFVKIYQAYRRQGIKHAGYLAGRIEIENTANGYIFEPPVLIGDGGKLLQLKN